MFVCMYECMYAYDIYIYIYILYFYIIFILKFNKDFIYLIKININEYLCMYVPCIDLMIGSLNNGRMFCPIIFTKKLLPK